MTTRARRERLPSQHARDLRAALNTWQAVAPDQPPPPEYLAYACDSRRTLRAGWQCVALLRATYWTVRATVPVLVAGAVPMLAIEHAPWLDVAYAVTAALALAAIAGNIIGGRWWDRLSRDMAALDRRGAQLGERT